MSKGSAPRNCFSKEFKENYGDIDWGDIEYIGPKSDSPITAENLAETIEKLEKTIKKDMFYNRGDRIDAEDENRSENE